MESDRWTRLKDEFAASSDLPSAERRERLALLAAENPELARRVEELLEADARADAILSPYDRASWASGEVADGQAAPGEAAGVDAEPATDPFGYAGQTVAQYRVLDVLGCGGMGVVYRAEDVRLGRAVALKFLLPQLSFDPLAKERFLNEARAASALDHPNVCTVYGFGETGRGHLFLAMAYYAGQTLAAHLTRSGGLAMAETPAIARQILLALGAAHDAGIVHRDLKPGNVMLLPDGTVKILDFGLAKVGGLNLTAPGLRPGTVAYMSPEQIEGEAVDRRSDLWSFGVVLYEVLTGRRPFGGGHDLSAAYAILNEEPAPPSRVRPEVPAPYDAIVQRLLAKDRQARYTQAADVLADLEAAWSNASPAGVGVPPGRARRRVLATAGVLGAVALVGTLAVLPAVRGRLASSLAGERAVPSPAASAGATRSEPSVAVLPFVDMSPGRDQEYFSDGMAEEILHALAQVPGLRVPARTSSFAFKGRSLPVAEIARQLGVERVLEGSVRKSGDTLRITVQLIDAKSDRHLWSRTFQRGLEDVFALQSDIARIVAESLTVRLAHAPAHAGARPASARAHDLYLQGRFHWNRRTTTDLRQAIRLFEEAARADSTYARAYAGLALAYAVLPPGGDGGRPDSTLPRVEAAAAKAIALDPSVAEAYTALGYAYHWHWRWEEAERALRRATELDPSNTSARQWYGEHLGVMGRGREAETELRRAVMLDPLSPIAHTNLGLVLMMDRRFQESIVQLETAHRMDPSLPVPLILLHRIYMTVGQLDEAATAGRRFAELMGTGKADDIVTLTRGTRSPRERDAARTVLARWKREPKPNWTEIARYYTVLGDREQALEALEHGFRLREPMVTGLRVAPWFDPLRNDPRFEWLVRAMRYP